MYCNTILKLDLIIIIIQKYCEKYLKPGKNIDIKKSKTIQFVLDQLNNIRKTKDFKTLKSIFTIEKKYKIKDLKDWLSILCVNKTELFSKHFKLEVEIDLTKSYRTYVNLLSKLGVNKTKCDLKTSTKKISILFNLLFYNIIDGGGRIKIKTVMHDKEPFDKLNTTFLSKDDLRTKATTLKRLGPSSSLYRGIRKQNGIDPELLAKLTPICKLSKNNKNFDRKNLTLKQLGFIIMHLKKKHKNLGDKNWDFLYRAFQDDFKREQWFLQNATGVVNPRSSLIANSIGLTGKSIEHIKKYSDIWYDFFNTKDIANFVRFNVRQNYLDNFKTVSFDHSQVSLKQTVKNFIASMDISDGVTYIDNMELMIYYAILLNFWTKNGDEWVKDGPSYVHSEGRFTKVDIDEFMFPMLNYIYTLLDGQIKIKKDAKMLNILQGIAQCKGSDEIETFVGLLSLLTLFFYDEVTKDYEESITVYFGKKMDIIHKMLDPSQLDVSYVLPQSASYEFRVAAINFNSHDVIGMMRLLPSDYKNYPYTVIPISFLSAFASEKEMLCISNEPYLSGPDYKDYLNNTSTIILKNLKDTFENVLGCDTTKLKGNVTRLVLFNKLQIINEPTYTSVNNHLLQSLLLSKKTESILDEQKGKLEISELSNNHIEINMNKSKGSDDIELDDNTEIEQLDSIIKQSIKP